jgi:hypothetical protein
MAQFCCRLAASLARCNAPPAIFLCWEPVVSRAGVRGRDIVGGPVNDRAVLEFDAPARCLDWGP